MVAQPANSALDATGSSPASAHDAAATQPKLPSLTPSPPSPPSPPLPPIPASDRPLLTRLLALHENYCALAAELATDQWNHLGESRPKDLLDLYAWADQPHIAAWLARHRELTDLQRRTTALTALETVLKTAPTPIERRRAASTILRALDGRWNHPRSFSIQNPQSKIQNRSAASPPLPLSTPTPKADPAQSLTDIRAALACPVPAVALSTLHAHSVKNAFIAGQPVHEAKTEWIATFPAKVFKGFEFPLITTQAGEILRNDTTSRWDLWLRNRANDLFRCTLTLIRDNPSDYPNPAWRIATLEVIPHNSG